MSTINLLKGLISLRCGHSRFLSMTQLVRRQTPHGHAHKEKLAEKPTSKTKSTVVPIWRHMTVSQLANSMGRPLDHVFEAMIYVPGTNAYDSPGSHLDDLGIVREIVKKCGYRTVVTPPVSSDSSVDPSRVDATSSAEDIEPQPRPINESLLRPREPVVTIMGHVDHGKTTLLDRLRDSNIVAGEAGGITQHIGAFRVPIAGSGNETQRWITFLDTPGHAAFSALRNRGAQATDIVILVVAAEDGVMEQTKESIRMAKEANVPMIVAINKIDKPDADPDRCRAMLLQEGIQLEETGGDTLSVCISALKGTGLQNLLDAIALQAEMLDLKAEASGPVEGVVLESSMSPGRGKVSTALIQRGKLRRGAYLVAGTAWAKVRGIFDETGEGLVEAGPSVPCEIIGWRDLPGAGENIYEIESEKRAKEIVEYRLSLCAQQKIESDAVAIQEKTEQHMKEYKAMLEQKRLSGYRYKIRRKGPRPKEAIESTDSRAKVSLVVKADVDGSVESFLDVLETFDESPASSFARLDVVSYGVGDLTETELRLAGTFGAKVYLFNAKISPALKTLAKELEVELRESRVIYRLVEELKKDIEELLPLKTVEQEIGVGQVLAGFTVTSETQKKKQILVAGARCTKGILKKDGLFKLIRRDAANDGAEIVVYNGPASSIRHLKNEVESVKVGVECGVGLEELEVGTDEPMPGDTIVCYKWVDLKQTCDWEPPGF